MIPEDLARAYYRRTAPERVRPVCEEVPWLTLAARACGFDRLEVHISAPRETSTQTDQVTRTYAPFTWFAQRGFSRFPHQDFSFGQKPSWPPSGTCCVFATRAASSSPTRWLTASTTRR